MITEDYISFEVAKLLRDKGFDAKCKYYYIQTKEMFEIDTRYHTSLTTQELLDLQSIGEKEDRYAAPTQAIAMKWLRIEHNIHIEPHIVRTERSYGYMPNYNDLKEVKPHFPFDEFDFSNADKYACITYDKACETTRKYCLENLIE